ncbi:MAG: 16S rRNA (cytosine(1402)-N(4))-methyltransferase RsmH [Holosporales bacterium]|jgi:16S rRNA (cytosine1402-N4)-methyltransferase|nr:16S rRNA (cytosine(1402)-N(4))-methyltransferase RsmH [Holosporales bacterium]
MPWLLALGILMEHVPVLSSEIVRILSPRDNSSLLDCTFGGGGHTKVLLETCRCYVCGLDRDPDAIQRAHEVKKKYNDRFDFVLERFSKIAEVFECGRRFDGVVFDFGISSFQIEDSSRGFSFIREAKIDMRMSKTGTSAYDVLNSFSEGDIADILWIYGEEPQSRRIASMIVKHRIKSRIETTTQLRDIVRKVYQFESINKKHSKIDVATKTFQAIRIFVNDELNEISEALNQLPEILNNNARIATISFHSLEDKIVKNWAKSRKDCVLPINKSVIKPYNDEILRNPRSRSAILRGFVYTKDRGL